MRSQYRAMHYSASRGNKMDLCKHTLICRWHTLNSTDCISLATSIERVWQWIVVPWYAFKCTRIGPRHRQPCCSLVTYDGHEIIWVDTLRYLGVYIKSSKVFWCSLDNTMKSFYRAFNSLFGKVGRAASEDVVIKLNCWKLNVVLCCIMVLRVFRSIKAKSTR